MKKRLPERFAPQRDHIDLFNKKIVDGEVAVRAMTVIGGKDVVMGLRTYDDRATAKLVAQLDGKRIGRMEVHDGHVVDVFIHSAFERSNLLTLMQETFQRANVPIEHVDPRMAGV